MNKELWSKIEKFDLDSPISKYGFSTRLSSENFWTKSFTEQAILEYKKFMYLAATNDLMVSPSETVDVVWHQHLIFTQSYNDFCTLIGKQIQHVPSTHNREDFQKFKKAKERTKELYEAEFGEQPLAIWDFKDMYESLNLVKAKLKLRTFIIIGILAFIALAVPLYFLLRPIYISINNPNFMFYYIGLCFIVFLGLEFYNKIKLKQIIQASDKNSFIFNLQPYELVYMKRQNISPVIVGVLSELLENKSIKLDADNNNLIEIDTIMVSTNSKEQIQTISEISILESTTFKPLIGNLISKPIFENYSNCINAFAKYFKKSEKFAKLFYLNFSLLSALTMIGTLRLITGTLRDKPVIIIATTVGLLTFLIIFYLHRLTKLVCTETVPDLYENEILPNRQVKDNWQWSYFLFGNTVLVSSIIPVAMNVSWNKNDDWDSCSSCGSSCGSSCSSCGGCAD